MRKHMKYLVFLLVGLFSLSGCGEPVAVEVSLETPGNGSSVSSLTPILSWNCNHTDASFRLQLSTENNFQNLIMDQSGLSSPSYTIPEGTLSEGQTYYWRVDASKGDHSSGWSMPWAFQTPGSSPQPPTPEPEYGTIVVKATFDGASWTGNVDYNISGPQAYSGSSADQTFSNVAVGEYTIGYSSGGPSEATFSDVSPNSTQTLSAGGTITFTLNFDTKAVTRVKVKATVDGNPWTGDVNYSVTGPQGYSGSSVSQTFSNVQAGTYTVGYSGGGPTGAALASITPQPTQSVAAGHTITFTLNFHSDNTSAIKVQATLDGSRWRGDVNYTLSGPFTDSHKSVNYTFEDLPAGTYTLLYNYGGPSGTKLTSITPQPTQTVSDNSTKTFTLNFTSQASSTIEVIATIDGQPWNGSVSYNIDGPYSDADHRVPQNHTNLPAGTYTVTYRSGGPEGATLSRISPSPSQTLDSGGKITFNLVFHSDAMGTITVNTLLDGQTWETAVGSGTINYGISGPRSDSSTSMPDTFTNLPSGDYTLTYHSGGPIGASLMGISPRPTQTLSSGGNISFTLNFHSEAKGTVMVNATCNGADWEGNVSYTLGGPYVDSSGSVPDTFNNCPAGHYTLSYNSGGPAGCTLYNITPGPNQDLSAGGMITFTLNFVGEPDDNGGLLK